MAAVSQPLRVLVCRRLTAVGLAVSAALCAPSVAEAHSTARVTALDDQARITHVGGAPVVRARVIDGDRKLELTVATGHTVVVLGDAGEPFLRFSSAGVAVNRRSPTALIDRLVERGSVPALDPGAPPAWSVLASGGRYSWHDHRLAPTGRSKADGDVVGWSVPLDVDGRHQSVEGRIWHASGPPLWPWLAVVGGVFVAAAVVVTRRERRFLITTAIASAAVASVAALLVRLALILAPGAESSAGWVGFAVSLAVPVGAGVTAAYMRDGPYTSTAPGLAATYAAFVGLGSAGVLVHGFVVSSWPAWSVRAAVVAAVACGLLGLVAAVTDVMRTDPDRRRRPVGGRRAYRAEPRRPGSRAR